MMRIRRSLILASSFVLVLEASIDSALSAPPEKPPAVLSPLEIPIGTLGKPLGSYLTISGIRAEAGKVGIHTLIVDTVDGRPLAQPVQIWIENLALPGKQRCTIKGFENARMIGDPPAIAKSQIEQRQPRTIPTQAGWQLQPFFVGLVVVSPTELRIPKPARTPSP